MRRPSAVSIAIAVGALAVYAPRACRAVALIGDSAEMVTAAVVFGVPHPPGYSLYTAFGHLIAIAGRSNPAFFLNLSSAVYHAAAVGLVACAIGLFTDSAAAMVAGAVALALSRSFLFGALYAEVFPLNDALFALLVVMGIRLGNCEKGGFRLLCAITAVSGLAAAHHLMFALAAPALAVLMGPALRRLARERPIAVAALPLLFAAPIAAAWAIILFAAARDPILSWGSVSDLGSLARLVTRQDYGGLLRASRFPAQGQLLERLDVFFASIDASVRPVGLLFAAAGALWLFRRSRREGTAMLLAFLCAGPVFAAMNAIDIRSEARVLFFERFTTMCHVPVGIMIGCGVAWLELVIRAWRRRLPGGAILTAVAVVPVAGNLAIDLRRDASGPAYARALVSEAPDRSLVLLTGDAPAHAALYACGVERICGARIFVAPLRTHLRWYLAQVQRRHPDLSMPTDERGSLDLAHMIADEIGRRPVLAHPELLKKDPDLARQFAWTPGPLLVRASAAK